MEHLHSDKFITIKVAATPVLTFAGIRMRYNLLDMAYGEWLIYKDKQPCYYINIFDLAYKELKNKISGNIENYLKNWLRTNYPDLSLNPNIIGLNVSATQNIEITVEKMTLHFLK